MQQYFDWPTFIKLDNAATIDYLTSLASGLAANGLIVEKVTLDLQLSLSSQPAIWASRGVSAVSALRSEHSEFLRIVHLRYGTTGAALNHIRFTIRPFLADLIACFGNWAEHCIKKSELVLNRPFFVYSDDTIARRELYPLALVALSKKLHTSAKALKEILDELSVMRPADILDVTGEIDAIETSIAKAIGFTDIDPLKSFSRAERSSLLQLSRLLMDLAETSSELFAQLSHNTSRAEEMVSVTALSELLTAESQRFQGLILPETASETVWETRRMAIAFGLFSIVQITAELSKSSLNAIAPIDHSPQDLAFSLDIERRLATELVRRGVEASKASEASGALVSYCKKHGVAPSYVIEPEIKKIHPDLRPETLTLYQKITTNDITITAGGSVAKDRIQNSFHAIRRGLEGILSVAFFISLFGIGGCGVKTLPKSTMEAIRPSIPFRVLPPKQSTLAPKKEIKKP